VIFAVGCGGGSVVGGSSGGPPPDRSIVGAWYKSSISRGATVVNCPGSLTSNTSAENSGNAPFSDSCGPLDVLKCNADGTFEYDTISPTTESRGTYHYDDATGVLQLSGLGAGSFTGTAQISADGKMLSIRSNANGVAGPTNTLVRQPLPNVWDALSHFFDPHY
jgi:hypothetical protein